MQNALDAIKKNGMRKMAWGLVALCSIFTLALVPRLSGAEFVECFIALVGAVMAANYGEHHEKAKDAPAEAPK